MATANIWETKFSLLRLLKKQDPPIPPKQVSAEKLLTHSLSRPLKLNKCRQDSVLLARDGEKHTFPAPPRGGEALEVNFFSIFKYSQFPFPSLCSLPQCWCHQATDHILDRTAPVLTKEEPNRRRRPRTDLAPSRTPSPVLSNPSWTPKLPRSGGTFELVCTERETR